MHKKLLVLFAALVLVAGMSFGQNTDSVNFELSMTVDEYIETIQNPVSFDFGTTIHTGNREELNTALTGPTGEWNFAYANCGFTLTVSGDNPASQGVPRFARAEVGPTASGFDILSTAYQIGIWTNGNCNNELGWNYGIRAREFPRTATTGLDEAPHNGQVLFKMNAKVNNPDGPTEAPGIPIRETLINQAFTWDQSADAGIYTCTMLVTLMAVITP